jgi:hypothetical protein
MKTRKEIEDRSQFAGRYSGVPFDLESLVVRMVDGINAKYYPLKMRS